LTSINLDPAFPTTHSFESSGSSLLSSTKSRNFILQRRDLSARVLELPREPNNAETRILKFVDFFVNILIRTIEFALKSGYLCN
jgi:hypothetical protein